MLKINSTFSIKKKCIMCENEFFIKTYSNPKHPKFGDVIPKHKKKIVCSRDCHRAWQKSISWEERIGEQRANEIREIRRVWAINNNPNSIPGISEKIGKSLKKYLAENPNSRIGENNPFYGKNHTAEQKELWRNKKRGKWSYSVEQKQKQTANTPKKEFHPAWQGGISSGEYGIEFSNELKENIKIKYNYTCQICGKNKVNLDVHHIDYVKTNNNITNLIPLCKICHGKTNFNRDKWKKILTEIKNHLN